MIADQLVQTVKDTKAFGLGVSFKAMRRQFTNKTTDLNLGMFGTITIRPHDSDYTIVRQVFRDRQYGGLPRVCSHVSPQNL